MTRRVPPMVGIVVIGRNEGPRLAACLESLRRAASPAVEVVGTVYVDSGSTDDSLALARERGMHAVELRAAEPPAPRFTAARARNAGAQALLAHHPDVAYLQFIDADTELDIRWLGEAAEFLEAHRDVAVACGRRREKYPEQSIYNALADVEWNTPAGIAREFGGDALIRAAVFRELGGYTPTLIAGEEPEFAARMRLAGYTVVRLDCEMTRHDLRMTRFGEWFRRMQRWGHALAQVHHLHGGAPLFIYRREHRSAIFWSAILPLGACIVAWLTQWRALALLPLAYILLGLRVAANRRRCGDRPRIAGAYAIFAVLGKFPQLLGMLTYHLNRLASRRPALIEYKPGSGASPSEVGVAAVGPSVEAGGGS